jgi:hypothetical protein
LIETRSGELELWHWTDADHELPVPLRTSAVARAA